MNGQCVCTADLATDPDHCGACDNACASGACQSGKCVGTVIASGGTPTRLAVDAANVYWLDRGTETYGVKKAPISGGTPIVLAQPTNPQRIAVDATHVYWTDGNYAAAKVPIEGGATTILSFNENGVALTLGPPNVYWISGDDVEDAVCMAPLVPGPTGVSLYSNLPARGVAMAADTTSAYWSTRDYQSSTGEILKMPLGGGIVTTLVSGPHEPGEIAIDETHLYWADGTAWDGTLWKVPLAGGEPTMLAAIPPGDADTICLARDGAWLYGSSAARIWRAPIDGGPAEILLDNVKMVHCIAVDATDIYWTNPEKGTVVKIPK